MNNNQISKDILEARRKMKEKYSSKDIRGKGGFTEEKKGG